MKNVSFYSLPRATQERFVSATQGSLAPLPLATSFAASWREGRVLFGAAAFCAFCAAVLLAWGFGDLSSPWSLPGRSSEFAVGLVTAATLTFLLRGLVLHDRLSALPYARGTYLFPVGVVVATSETLAVFPIGECEFVRREIDGLTVGFAGREPFHFRCANPSALQSAEAVVRRTHAQIQANRAPQSERARAELDPLYSTGFPAPLSSPHPLRPRHRGVARLLTLGAAAAGFALGFEVGGLRNLVSEQRVLVHAQAADSVEAYQTYVRHGGNDAQVRRLLLPRAKLRQATRQGNVEAIQVLANTHGSSEIRSDIDRALTRALLNALRQARAEGTLASLEAFKQLYPDHAPVSRQLREARHSLFVQAADAFQLRARPSTRRRNVAGFFRSLLAYSEQHGPRVDIRFRPQLGASLGDADRKVRAFRRGHYYRGARTLPSRQFTRLHLEPIEQAATQALIQGLQSLFPKELLTFRPGPRLDPLDADASDRTLPEFDTPTLVVDYRVELSGRLFPTDHRKLFVGAGYFFDARWAMPVSSPPLRVSHTTWRNPSRQARNSAHARFAKIYGDMSRHAFDKFVRSYLQALVVSPPRTFRDTKLAVGRSR